MNIYKALSEGGGYSLPYLLHIYNNNTDLYLINDVADLAYDGHLYKASNFSYEPEKDGAASLDIEIVEAHEIINILEGVKINIEAVGVLDDTGDIIKIEQFKHHYGSASWNGDTLNIKLEADDRLNMTFPALIFNSNNSRGNA